MNSVEESSDHELEKDKPTVLKQNKECKSCIESIDIRANRCKFCQSYQDWRRHVILFATIISILLTISTTLVAFFSYVNNKMEKEFNGADINFLNSDENFIYVSIYNGGTRSIKIGEVSLTFKDRNSNDEIFPTYFQLKVNGDNNRILPKKEADIKIKFDKRVGTRNMIYVSSDMQQITRDKQELNIEIISFNGKSEPILIKIPDHKINQFIKNHITIQIPKGS